MANQSELKRLLAKVERQNSRPQSNRSGGSKLPGTRESKADIWGGSATARGVQFGRPSNNRTTTSTSSDGWTHLLSQGARSGLSSLFGGGVLEGFDGLSNIVSSLFGLFGSKKNTPPPLTLFSLPSSHNESVYFASHSSQPSQGPIYTDNHVSTLQYHSAEIAQAVKHALLTSSTLNDVIAEL